MRILKAILSQLLQRAVDKAVERQVMHRLKQLEKRVDYLERRRLRVT